MWGKVVSFSILALLLLSCASEKDAEWKMYRNSPTDVKMRLLIASFNADESGEYNHANCEIARELFESQPGVTVNYWCELS